MKPSGTTEEKGTGMFGLRAKQKRLLRYTFLIALLAGTGIATYLYISAAPERAEAQFQDAMKLMKPGHYEEAAAGFTRAIRTWPQLADAYFERGNAYHALNRDDEALADFEKAADLMPSPARAYAAIGSIYRVRKDYKRAMESYSKSIGSNATVDAYFERAQTYEILGEHQKAVSDYDKAILKMPDAPAVYRARSLARRNLGDEPGYEADRDTANRMEHRQ
jgi:tetratricopeptide (TPR) repeat protein